MRLKLCWFRYFFYTFESLTKITRKKDIAYKIFRRKKLDVPYHFPRCRRLSRPKGGQRLFVLVLDLLQKATQRRMTRGRQSSRETGFSFHEISKASRRPPGTRTGKFIKIETRHLCREFRIRRKSDTKHDTYLLEFVSLLFRKIGTPRKVVRCETSPQG